LTESDDAGGFLCKQIDAVRSLSNILQTRAHARQMTGEVSLNFTSDLTDWLVGIGLTT
jgi:hypothetical protein